MDLLILEDLTLVGKLKWYGGELFALICALAFWGVVLLGLVAIQGV